MKKILLGIIFCVSICAVPAFSQGNYIDDFDTTFTIPLRIDTSLAGNIWQIGRPQKIIFDSAYSAPNAIVTDTLNPYLVNNRSSFIITVRDSMVLTQWPIAFLEVQFMHKYDTDTLHDGCYIELSTDGLLWQNIIYSPYYYLGFNNMYTSNDTIAGGTHAFSGTSSGWQMIDFYLAPCTFPSALDSMMLRFTFQSDSINNNNEGWMIDNISLATNICEGVEEYNSTSQIILSPNPATNEIRIQSTKFNVDGVEIYDVLGRKAISQKPTANSP